jgi:hypothetical protein
MDELIDRLATKAGIENVVTEETTEIMPGFRRNVLIDKIPGAEIAASSKGGSFNRLMGSGLMAIGTWLIALGLGISEIQGIACELFKFCRDKIGADQMGEIIAGTPGLGQFA